MVQQRAIAIRCGSQFAEKVGDGGTGMEIIQFCQLVLVGLYFRMV
jgi:hypothetical protein